MITPDKDDPLWQAFLHFDKARHCGVPYLMDPDDREAWEAFQAGAAHSALIIKGLEAVNRKLRDEIDSIYESY